MATTEPTVPASGLPAAAPGKYLTFTLGDESYGITVLAVREIIRLCPITPVASMPAHVKGVINLRGKVIPVVDLRTRFGLPPRIDDDRTCVIVTELATATGGSRLHGVIVDRVDEVAAFVGADIEPTPDFGGAIDVRFITGMAKAADRVTALVDLASIAAAELPGATSESHPTR
ncbi:MAG: chemotaxis protein CheW [Pirellulales bacterium]|jgi:purine-binding chemotaxis protein CheW